MLEVFTLDRCSEWDSIVRSFENNIDVYWLSGYVRSFEINGDGKPLMFYYQDKNTRGINVVMLRDISEDERFASFIPHNTYFDLSTPYGYGGWIIEGDNTNELFSQYYDWINRNSIISEFVRFHPMIMNHKRCKDHYDIVRLGEVVHIDLSSKDIIISNLKSKNRNMIRKAINSGIEINIGKDPDTYEKFMNIYNDTMKRNGADKYYFFRRDFYNSLSNDFGDNACVFWAEKDGIMIAASIFLTFNGFMNYHLSGSMQEYRSYAPNNLLLYKAALWGCSNGFKTLYLGGGLGSGNDSLFSFKRSFYKGELNHFYIGKKVYNEKVYGKLVEFNGNKNSSYFPLYRA